MEPRLILINLLVKLRETRGDQAAYLPARRRRRVTPPERACELLEAEPDD